MSILADNFNAALSSNILFGLLLALIAGFLSSFSPCILTSVPLIISYVGGYAGDNKRKAFIYSVVFVIGIIITFTTLGLLSVLLGRALTFIGSWWYLLLGILMILMGFQMLDIINLFPSRNLKVLDRKGMLGAFLLGLFGGIFCAPCSAPILVIILAVVAEKGEILLGALLLLFYAIGHSVLLVIAGSSIGIAEKLTKSTKTVKVGTIFKYTLGILILVIALYLLYLGF